MLKTFAFLISLLTKFHSWDSTYTEELGNLEADPNDSGTVWFSDALAEEKIVKFLRSRIVTQDHPSILDLGTGNGEMLFALLDEGFHGKMMGVDYSAPSVELARRVAAERGWDQNVTFKVWDVLTGRGEDEIEEDIGQWNVVLDKGTFDAVSLSGIPNIEVQYVQRVKRLVSQEGLFLVTSCNWTEAELTKWFLDNGALKHCGRIGYPTFKFGGATGQTISTVCFLKSP